MRTPTFAFLFMSIACLHVQWTSAFEMDPCLDKLSPEIKKEAMEKMEVCKKKLSLADFPKLEELEKSGFDDKCFSKCIMTEMKVFTDKNTLDDKVFADVLKKFQADKQADISKTWKTCSESLKKTMDAEGGITDKNACKTAAIVKHCFVEGVRKMC